MRLTFKDLALVVKQYQAADVQIADLVGDQTEESFVRWLKDYLGE